jgi:cation diffusion facilitator CzcD-associated flavoprotein CzcO
MQYIRLRHELTHAVWDEDAGNWRLRIRHAGAASGGGDLEIDDTADVLLLGVGLLNRPKWPDIPGLRDFQGPLLHSAQWDVGDLDGSGVPQDWYNKTVGVIGNVILFLLLLCGFVIYAE